MAIKPNFGRQNVFVSGRTSSRRAYAKRITKVASRAEMLTQMLRILVEQSAVFKRQHWIGIRFASVPHQRATGDGCLERKACRVSGNDARIGGPFAIRIRRRKTTNPVVEKATFKTDTMANGQFGN
jgi:hypothetical protein